jgi:hypothetical protein
MAAIRETMQTVWDFSFSRRQVWSLLGYNYNLDSLNITIIVPVNPINRCDNTKMSFFISLRRIFSYFFTSRSLMYDFRLG